MKPTFQKLTILILALTMLLSSVPAVAAVQDSTVPTESTSTPQGDQQAFYHYAETPDGDAVNAPIPQPAAEPISDDVDFAAENPVPVEDAIVMIRKALAAHESGVTVEFMLAEDIHDDISDLLYELAVVHTGVPNEGDYITRNGATWATNIRYGERSNGWYYKVQFAFAYYTTAQQEAMVDAEVDRILTKLDLWNASDYEKVCGIYDYICSNVTYDYENLEDDDYYLKYTTYAAVINKTAVCQGFASMFYRLALELGVDARYIRGYASGVNHGWNIVQIAGHYYNLDATWDSENSSYGYFLRGTGSFPGHSRRSEYNTAEFNADYPTSRWNYAAWLDPADGVLETGYCTADLEWMMLTDNTLAFLGEGAIPDYSINHAPWNKYGYRIQNIYLDHGVTRIGDSAFADFDALRSVYISDGVNSIGDYAFYSSDVLDTVGLPADLTSMEGYVFNQCSALTRIVFYGSAPQISSSAFSGVSATAYYYNDGSWTASKQLSYGGSLSWLSTGGYRVIFRNWNGRTLYADIYDYGDTVYIPNDPARPSDDTYCYVFSGWSPAVSATCRGEAVYTATYTTRIKPELAPVGDFTGDEDVSNDDVIYLLWHTMFNDDYPIAGDADFNHDGTVDHGDVVYLLWHNLFGADVYPIT